ncbi:MAG: glycosyltransferase [Litorilinea sp.]
MELPKISVIVLNFNGKNHLQTCLSSLVQMDYPADKLELLLVDNASGDGSAAYVRANFPTVRVVENGENLGFAAGNNVGARAATGDYIAFLNNDTRVDPNWLRALVQPCLADAETVCAASKMLDWDGKKADFVRATINFHGFAFQPEHGLLDLAHAERELIFACGGAMLINRTVFLDIGGFDEDYFIYFEDMDLGWRLWLMGYRVVFAPEAIVYHRLHATMDAFSAFRKWVLFERNALVTLIKNYDDANLAKILPGALMLMIARATRLMRANGWRTDAYDIRNPAETGLTEAVSRSGLAVLVAANEVVENLPHILEKRRAVQAKRKRSDAEVFVRFGQPMLAHTLEFPAVDELYVAAQSNVLHELGIADLFAHTGRRVLVVASDLLPFAGLPTTGAGLRAWSIGQGLIERGHEVLYSMPKAAMEGREQRGENRAWELFWEAGKIHEVVRKAQPDVIVACGWSTLANLEGVSTPVILDQHGPHLLERRFQKHLDEAVNRQEKLYGLAKADFFTCAGERQRQYFLPWLEEAGFQNPDAESAVVHVSLGGEWPAVKTQSSNPSPNPGPVFVYGGVFLPWQDPLLALTTLVARMDALGTGKLKIFGGKHPFIPIDTREFEALIEQLTQSPRVEVSPMLSRDALLAEYAQADAAIDLMARNPERELAVTTRTVEYLWCGLPVIYNDYAELSDYIGAAEAGWCLDPTDAQAMTQTFDEILKNPEILTARGQNARRLAEQSFNWANTTEPIDQFCRKPYKRVRTAQTSALPAKPSAHAPAPTGLPRKGVRTLAGEAMYHFRRGGVRGFLYESLGFLQRRLSK